MEIYLLRHGAAEPGRPGRPDGERELTHAGRERVAAVMRGVSHAMNFSAMLSSPYKRTLQTARIAIDELKLQIELLETEALTPDSRPQDAWDEIRLHEGGVFAVLHEPLISALSAFILYSPGIALEFDTATMIALETTNSSAQPRGMLKWMVSGEIMSRPEGIKKGKP
jgi:phosphohistidine phosphatase SixA